MNPKPHFNEQRDGFVDNIHVLPILEGNERISVVVRPSYVIKP